MSSAASSAASLTSISPAASAPTTVTPAPISVPKPGRNDSSWPPWIANTCIALAPSDSCVAMSEIWKPNCCASTRLRCISGPIRPMAEVMAPARCAAA